MQKLQNYKNLSDDLVVSIDLFSLSFMAFSYSGLYFCQQPSSMSSDASGMLSDTRPGGR